MHCAMLQLNPRAASAWRLSASPESFESSSGTAGSTWIWTDPPSTHTQTGTMASLSSTLWPTGGAFDRRGQTGLVRDQDWVRSAGSLTTRSSERIRVAQALTCLGHQEDCAGV
jgi:hypothetical protein